MKLNYTTLGHGPSQGLSNVTSYSTNRIFHYKHLSFNNLIRVLLSSKEPLEHLQFWRDIANRDSKQVRDAYSRVRSSKLVTAVGKGPTIDTA